MKEKIGKYYFCRHRGIWAIYQYNAISNNSVSSSFIKNVVEYEAAVELVYQLNGWGEPKQIKRIF